LRPGFENAALPNRGHMQGCNLRILKRQSTICYLLHPPLLDEAGFASAARWFVESFAKRSGIECRLDLPERLGRLPETIEVDLLRILQESLTNVHRHSGTSSVEIQLRVNESQVLLTVRDFGRGMPAGLIQRFGANGRSVGVGLTGMRERIHDLSGTFEVQSDTHGTAIVVAVPLAEQPSGTPVHAA
jgi:two-component system NarL family sensor kinase